MKRPELEARLQEARRLVAAGRDSQGVAALERVLVAAVDADLGDLCCDIALLLDDLRARGHGSVEERVRTLLGALSMDDGSPSGERVRARLALLQEEGRVELAPVVGQDFMSEVGGRAMAMIEGMVQYPEAAQVERDVIPKVELSDAEKQRILAGLRAARAASIAAIPSLFDLIVPSVLEAFRRGEPLVEIATTNPPTSNEAIFANALLDDLVVAFTFRDYLAAPPTGGSPGSVSLAGELDRLSDLRARGLLSDAEFQAAKRSVLGP